MDVSYGPCQFYIDFSETNVVSSLLLLLSVLTILKPIQLWLLILQKYLNLQCSQDLNPWRAKNEIAKFSWRTILITWRIVLAFSFVSLFSFIFFSNFVLIFQNIYKSQSKELLLAFWKVFSLHPPPPFILITGTKSPEEILFLGSYNKLTDFSLVLCTDVQWIFPAYV